MAHNLCVRINFECINGKKCVSAPGQENKYLVHTFNDPVLNILLSEDYKDWKKIEVWNNIYNILGLWPEIIESLRRLI